MIAVSCYLTRHFYQVHFPNTNALGEGSSLCDLSSFWNCDAATLSPMSQFLGIPTAFFGLALSILFLLFTLLGFPSSWYFSIFWLSTFNFIGCVSLAGYSLLQLGALCPGCTLYYVLSTILFISLQPMKTSLLSFQVPLGAWIAIIVLFGGGGASMKYLGHSLEKPDLEFREKIAAYIAKVGNIAPLMAEYSGREYNAEGELPMRSSAPIKASIFSDFQCPGCKYVHDEILPKLARVYRGKIHIEIFDSPMDPECNPSVPANMTGHALACQAAYLAHCGSNSGIHHLDQEIFALQGRLTSGSLQGLANKYKVSPCFHSNQVRTMVSRDINVANQIQIPGTPTMVFNGVILPNPLPLKQLMIFIELVLEKEQQKQMSHIPITKTD